MTIEALIYAALAPLVDGRVYPDVAEEGSALPRIVYQEVGGNGLAFTEGTLPDHEGCRMQVVAWGEQRLAVTALAKQIKEALMAVPELQVEPLGGRTSVHEPDTGLRGSRQDFSIWAPR